MNSQNLNLTIEDNREWQSTILITLPLYVGQEGFHAVYPLVNRTGGEELGNY